jgi:S-adenosylmethionine:tRNA ribosyltransferase-isomerase
VRPSDFHYELPEELIAQEPPAERDGARLLCVDGRGLRDARFAELVDAVPAGAVVVLNDTRVIPARLRGHKSSGGAVELLLVEQTDTLRWLALARSSKRLRTGTAVALAGGGEARIAAERSDDGLIEVELSDADVVDRCGEVPLPPYIRRPRGATAFDRERYQTVFARAPGAVAAPTAGLHFTPELLARIAARGCALAYVTLHVGPGTFAPVRVDDLAHHVMHAERYEIPDRTAELVASGRPVVAVGTTVVRALESGDRRGVTRLFIRPGFRFRVVDFLVTNFHLPESTLLMLVSAFLGHQRTMAAYRHAVEQRYRFFSYGDAMFGERAA